MDERQEEVHDTQKESKKRLGRKYVVAVHTKYVYLTNTYVLKYTLCVYGQTRVFQTTKLLYFFKHAFNQ